MKIIYISLFLLLALPSSRASLYQYPEKIRPEVSLSDAILITKEMLKTQNHAERYHIVGTALVGDESQSGDGAWTLFLYDSEENQVWAHIELRGSFCSLAYYPHDHSEKGVSTEIEFERDGFEVGTPLNRKEPNQSSHTTPASAPR